MHYIAGENSTAGKSYTHMPSMRALRMIMKWGGGVVVAVLCLSGRLAVVI